MGWCMRFCVYVGVWIHITTHTIMYTGPEWCGARGRNARISRTRVIRGRQCRPFLQRVICSSLPSLYNLINELLKCAKSIAKSERSGIQQRRGTARCYGTRKMCTQVQSSRAPVLQDREALCGFVMSVSKSSALTCLNQQSHRPHLHQILFKEVRGVT